MRRTIGLLLGIFTMAAALLVAAPAEPVSANSGIRQKMGVDSCELNTEM